MGTILWHWPRGTEQNNELFVSRTGFGQPPEYNSLALPLDTTRSVRSFLLPGRNSIPQKE
jgi:hypothetical protein